ncbi:hypothetical protein [Protaetiibacter larvae]|uniref:Uncharacterized protein n=1 Tax=Protaetiibacter larvae TaxID=2592654 RepID=A0A5C1Y7N2_9MICO|nr:hypothetical protein [Protaetiibacter larvae]QEO09205.1 hypothetical protein FLP23_03765 [Protaetiibacter larvae]
MAETIDPRFDPAFQRGYSGTVTTGSRAEAAARRSAPYVASALQRPSSDPPPAERQRVAEQVPPPPPAPDAAVEQLAPVVVQVPEQTLRAPWTNPFVVAVTVLGIGVLSFGVWLIQETFRMFEEDNGFGSQMDYWLMQSTLFSGPVAIAVGVAILAGVLFLCAGYWARRPRVAPTPLED